MEQHTVTKSRAKIICEVFDVVYTQSSVPNLFVDSGDAKDVLVMGALEGSISSRWLAETNFGVWKRASRVETRISIGNATSVFLNLIVRGYDRRQLR